MPSGGSQQQQQSNQTQFTTNNVPAWVEQASQNQLGVANSINAAGYDPNRNQSVAPLSPLSNQAADITQNFVAGGGSQPAYNTALGATEGLLSFRPTSVTPGTVSSTGVAGNTDAINSAMSPYISNVIDASNAAGQSALKQALQNNESSAAASKAFGGSRNDILDASTIAQYGLGQSQLAANLYNQGYNTATGLLSSDAARDLQAQGMNQSTGLSGQIANQNASISGAGVVNAAAGQTGNLAGAAQTGLLAGTNALNQFGTQAQTTAQNVLNAGTTNADKSYATKQANLQALIQALQGSQYSTFGTGASSGARNTTTTNSPDWATAALGAGRLISSGGLGSGLSSLGSGISSVGSSLAGLLAL